jgi:hypothetical protein
MPLLDNGAMAASDMNQGQPRVEQEISHGAVLAVVGIVGGTNQKKFVKPCACVLIEFRGDGAVLVQFLYPLLKVFFVESTEVRIPVEIAVESK